MDIQGDMPITLVIKAPNQRMEDQTVDCMLGWTIRKLKYHLECVYPSKPKHHEQRLIYSGKLLQDHLTLKEILIKQFDTDSISSTHTVHLVCSSTPSLNTSSSTSQRAREQTSPQAAPSNPVSNSEAELSASSDNSSVQNDGLRHRGSSQWQNVTVSSSFQSFPTQLPFPPMANQVPPAGYQYTPEQYTWMVQQQQAAYSQYMMQYMQYYQMYSGGQPFVAGGVISPMNPLNMPAPAATLVPPTPPRQQQNAEQPPAAAPGGNNEQRGNVRMNAQGGMDEDDEDERDPRDWLHHIYFIMRFITFVGIIVFYSSFSRFVMVMAGFLVIYFLQKMRVARGQHVRRQQQQQEQQRREEEERQQQQQQQEQEQTQVGSDVPEQQAQESQQDNATKDNGSEESNSNTEESNATTAEQSAQEVPQEEEGNKLMRSLYFILKTIETFFSSLVPAPPELMEAN